VYRKTKSCNFILSTIGQADIAPNIPTALSGAVAIRADICQHRLYLAILLQFFGLTSGRIVLRKTKSINFILNSVGQADGT
jgi:hypothetical protein